MKTFDLQHLNYILIIGGKSTGIRSAKRPGKQENESSTVFLETYQLNSDSARQKMQARSEKKVGEFFNAKQHMRAKLLV